MMYNIITLADGTQQKLDGKYSEEEVIKMCADNNIQIQGVHRAYLVPKGTFTEEAQDGNVESGKLLFKLYHGYKDTDFFNIPEQELVRAKYKQILGGDEVYSYGGYSIQAKTILKITPDTNSVLGYNADYKPQGEDIRIAQNIERQHMTYLAKADDVIKEAITRDNTAPLLRQMPVDKFTELLRLN